MTDYTNWLSSCKSRLVGQDFLLQEIILNFMQKRSNDPGFHGIIVDGISGSGKTALGQALFGKKYISFHLYKIFYSW